MCVLEGRGYAGREYEGVTPFRSLDIPAEILQLFVFRRKEKWFGRWEKETAENVYFVSTPASVKLSGHIASLFHVTQDSVTVTHVSSGARLPDSVQNLTATY